MTLHGVNQAIHKYQTNGSSSQDPHMFVAHGKSDQLDHWKGPMRTLHPSILETEIHTLTLS